jgi:DNA-binding response OmpR family regulator
MGPTDARPRVSLVAILRWRLWFTALGELPTAGKNGNASRRHQGSAAGSGSRLLGVGPQWVAVDATILLVEDDASVREVTRLGLQRAGFVVLTAGDGREGLSTFRSQRPDLVLLDVMLPGLDGLEVCRAIRTESAVPMVMLTARSDTVDVVVGLESGADDYVTKPFEMPELVARVRSALRRATQLGQAEIVTLGSLRIDIAAHRIDRDGSEVALTPTEFRLLVELARRPGQVFTREMLLERVWGYGYLGDSRLVDVAVQRLRSKVEPDPANPGLIVTVRGVGYRAGPR